MPDPHDSVEMVLNTARVRFNDAIEALGGEVITDTAPFTQVAVNAAWRRLQEILADFGFAALDRETVFSAVPATLSSDIGNFCRINWAGYYNGSATVAAPVLPQDMIAPLDLYERANVISQPFVRMDQCLNGLPTVQKQALNKLWEWRGETIYLPGATAVTDIRLRYAGYLADFVDNSPLAATPWYQQKVPIMRALNPLAWFICSELSRARGDTDAGFFDQQGEKAAEQVFNRDPRQARSLYKRSELGKMGDQHTPTAGPAGPRGGSQ